MMGKAVWRRERVVWRDDSPVGLDLKLAGRNLRLVAYLSNRKKQLDEAFSKDRWWVGRMMIILARMPTEDYG